MSDTVALACSTAGTGPALIFLHGLYGSGNNWRGIARPLEASHHVLLPDLRSHGGSPQHPDMDYRRMAADVIALMDRHDCATARIVGHSMGGKVAMAMALCSPERVDRALVVDIAPVAYDHSAEHGGIIAALQQLDTRAIRNRDEADAALAAAIPHPQVRQFLLTNLQRSDAGWDWRIPLAILADQLPVIQGWPLADRPASTVPALFLHGGASDYVDAEGRRAIARQFPQAAIEAIAGVGHWVHAEAPKPFAARLQQFLDPNHPNPPNQDQGQHHGRGFPTERA